MTVKYFPCRSELLSLSCVHLLRFVYTSSLLFNILFFILVFLICGRKCFPVSILTFLLGVKISQFLGVHFLITIAARNNFVAKFFCERERSRIGV